MTKTVLVVDDSETDLLLARLTLEGAGIADRLLLMSSVEDALACPGLDGFDFLARYGQQTPVPAPVVMLSASPDPADRQRALAHACVRDFLSKPLDPAKAASLRAHLGP